jgi:hypothetical protein
MGECLHLTVVHDIFGPPIGSRNGAASIRSNVEGEGAPTVYGSELFGRQIQAFEAEKGDMMSIKLYTNKQMQKDVGFSELRESKS